MKAFHWQSVIDFIVLASALYLLLRWSRQARALRLALAILGLRVGALLARQLDLVITSWVLDAATVIALLSLIVVFQPELRRALMRFDISGRGTQTPHGSTLFAVGAAAWSLAQARCGALIVIARKDSLAELVSGGVTLGGHVSTGVLTAVFQKASPVHDGAVIIEGESIARVGVILPLTQRTQIRDRFGTRHRAGLGLAERSDALVVVCSEERGEVTLMWADQVRLMKSAEELVSTMGTLIERNLSHPAFSLAALRSPETVLKGTAVALAALVWSLTFLFPGRSVRVRTIPVEFTNVPAGLTIAAPSTDTLEVWLRGSQFLFETVNLEAMVARCDLGAAHEGLNAIALAPGAIETPLGIRVETVAPQQIRVRLLSRTRLPSGD
jgi:diadenylate cyclase